MIEPVTFQEVTIHNETCILMMFYTNGHPYVIDITNEYEYNYERFGLCYLDTLIHDLQGDIAAEPDSFVSQTIKDYIDFETNKTKTQGGIA